MAEFVEEGDADFFAVDGFVAVREVPEVFEEEDDLRGDGHGHAFAVGEGFADEEAEGVGFDMVGDAFPDGEGMSMPIPPQIILVLENLWDFSDGDEAIYREEIRITLLHELGHYLGLDELDLEDRGLD